MRNLKMVILKVKYQWREMMCIFSFVTICFWFYISIEHSVREARDERYRYRNLETVYEGQGRGSEKERKVEKAPSWMVSERERGREKWRASRRGRVYAPVLPLRRSALSYAKDLRAPAVAESEKDDERHGRFENRHSHFRWQRHQSYQLCFDIRKSFPTFTLSFFFSNWRKKKKIRGCTTIVGMSKLIIFSCNDLLTNVDVAKELFQRNLSRPLEGHTE